MFDKLSRSVALLRASLAVLRADKELLVFPLCSTIASLLVVASFALPLVASGALESLDAGESPGAGTVLIAFLFYLTQYFVIFFFNTALVGAAMIRLDGGDPTRSEEHTSELQSRENLVCRLLLPPPPDSFPLSLHDALPILASFALPLVASGALESLDAGESPGAGTVLIAFLFYLTQYFVIFFFNTALVGAAMIRLDGGDPT